MQFQYYLVHTKNVDESFVDMWSIPRFSKPLLLPEDHCTVSMGTGWDLEHKAADVDDDSFATKPSKTKGSLCEDCGEKSKNYGTVQEWKRRWCGGCAKKHGGVLLRSGSPSSADAAEGGQDEISRDPSAGDLSSEEDKAAAAAAAGPHNNENSSRKAKAKGSLCEDCGEKSKNYGTVHEWKRRWCGGCAKKHGGVLLKSGTPNSRTTAPAGDSDSSGSTAEGNSESASTSNEDGALTTVALIADNSSTKGEPTKGEASSTSDEECVPTPVAVAVAAAPSDSSDRDCKLPKSDSQTPQDSPAEQSSSLVEEETVGTSAAVVPTTTHSGNTERSPSKCESQPVETSGDVVPTKGPLAARTISPSAARTTVSLTTGDNGNTEDKSA
eukprot:SAG31_NODE_1808_length_7230_cov_32.785835_3_plen_383_part_00